MAGSFTVVLVMSAAALAAMEISPSRITSFLMMTFFPALSAFPFSAGFSSVLAWLSAFNSAFSAEAVFFFDVFQQLGEVILGQGKQLIIYDRFVDFDAFDNDNIFCQALNVNLNGNSP